MLSGFRTATRTSSTIVNIRQNTRYNYPSRYHLWIVRIDVEKLKELREERALSLRELSEASGVSHTTIWEHERGKIGAHPRTVRLLAEALGVTPRELMVKEATDA